MTDITTLAEMSKERLRLDEGLVLHPYPDTHGNMTVGYGRNLTGSGLNRGEAEYLLDNDVAARIADLVRHLPWFGELDVVRQSVLVNMHFNLRPPGVMGFVKMLAACAAKDWVRAGDEIENSDAGRELVDRYHRLAQMMRTGVKM